MWKKNLRRCYRGMNRLTLTASCRYTNALRRIPCDIPRNAIDIILVGDFNKIEIFNWSNWTSLRLLALKGIELSQIGPFLWHGLALVTLSLESNNISFISNDTFLCFYVLKSTGAAPYQPKFLKMHHT